MIYFAQIGKKGPIKIGYSVWPTHRLAGLRVSVPWDVNLLGSVDGSKDHELYLHRYLKTQRMKGDWFRPSDLVKLTLEHVLDGEFPFPDYLRKTQECPRTHCVEGHEFTDDNSYIDSAGRLKCRTCMKVYQEKKKLEECT